MVLFPLVVYPLVSLATVQVLAARIGRGEKVPARVAISGPQPIAEQLRARLAARTPRRQPGLLAVARRRRRRPPPTCGPAASTRRSPSRSRRPARRGAADGARAVRRDAGTLTHRAHPHRRGAGRRRSSRAARRRTRSPSRGWRRARAMGGYLLSRILPLVIVVMVMLGAFHPAIDITAGERERGTLETTLSAPIARAALMTGKVVAVATLATLSGVLNLASMSITVLEGAKLAAAGAAPSLPVGERGRRRAAGDPARRVPVRVGHGRDRRARAQLQGGADAADAGLFPVHGAVAAGGAGRLRAAAARRRSSRASASRLLARDVIAGHASVGAIVAVFASSVGYGAAALALACRLYDSERLLGADDAGLGLRAWLRHLLFGPRATRRRSRRPHAPTRPTRRRPRATRSRCLASRWLLLFAFVARAEMAARARPRAVRVGRPARPHRRVRARQRPPLASRCCACASRRWPRWWARS